MKLTSIKKLRAEGFPEFRFHGFTKRFRDGEENPFYIVSAPLVGKLWYIGARDDDEDAAKLYDSALYHLFGYFKAPRRFNCYDEGDPIPASPIEIPELRRKVNFYLRKRRIDPESFQITFPERDRCLDEPEVPEKVSKALDQMVKKNQARLAKIAAAALAGQPVNS